MGFEGCIRVSRLVISSKATRDGSRSERLAARSETELGGSSRNQPILFSTSATIVGRSVPPEIQMQVDDHRSALGFKGAKSEQGLADLADQPLALGQPPMLLTVKRQPDRRHAG